MTELLLAGTKIVSFISQFAVLACIVWIIAGGFKLMNAGGSPQRAEAAKSGLFYALMGFGVVLLAFIGVNSLASMFGSIPGVINPIQLFPSNPQSIDPPSVVSISHSPNETIGGELILRFSEPINCEGYVAIKLSIYVSAQSSRCQQGFTGQIGAHQLIFQHTIHKDNHRGVFAEQLILGAGAYIRDLDGNNALLGFERLPLKR